MKKKIFVIAAHPCRFFRTRKPLGKGAYDQWAQLKLQEAPGSRVAVRLIARGRAGEELALKKSFGVGAGLQAQL